MEVAKSEVVSKADSKRPEPSAREGPRGGAPSPRRGGRERVWRPGEAPPQARAPGLYFFFSCFCFFSCEFIIVFA